MPKNKKHGEVNEKFVNLIQKHFSADNLIINNLDALSSYASDESACRPVLPQAVVFPENKQQIQNIVKLASEFKIPITPRGSGTGVCGGAIPYYGGIVVSLKNLNNITDIDESNFHLMTQCGTILEDIYKHTEQRGLFYPPDPNSWDTCSIGGNIATSAGGPRCVKYGITRDYIREVTFVTPSGEIAKFGGKYNKISTGYNLLQMLIGSEGTLGIVTDTTLKLIPKPLYSIDFLIPFSKFEAAASIVPKIIKEDFNPAVIEFVDEEAVKYGEKFLNKKFPKSDRAKAYLIISLDSFDYNSLERQTERLGNFLLDNQALEVFVADTNLRKEQIWEMRRKLREAIKHVGKKKLSEDIVVPRDLIPVFLRKLKQIKKATGVNTLAYGHAGDGNVHVNIIKDDMPEKEWKLKSKQAVKKVFELTISLGGTISGEHGIGLSKKPYLSMVLSRNEINLMKNLKKSWDKNNIMNPGKIFNI